MENGSRELTRGASAYAACLVFVLAFLVTTATGGSAATAVFRGAIAAAATYLLGRLLLLTLMSTVLDAMARDSVAKDNTEDS